MAVTTTDSSGMAQKVARYGTAGAMAAGAVALIVFARSEQGRQKIAALVGDQFGSIEGQLQMAIRENLPLVEEAIDRLVETLHEGINSLSAEVDRLGDMLRERVHDYAHSLPAEVSGSADSPGTTTV